MRSKVSYACNYVLCWNAAAAARNKQFCSSFPSVDRTLDFNLTDRIPQLKLYPL